MTLVEKVISMLHTCGLANKFWVDTVLTADYVLNISPTYVVYGKTPHEAWFKLKPNVSHLRVFGCVAFAHQLAQHVQRWDNRAIKGILLAIAKTPKLTKSKFLVLGK